MMLRRIPILSAGRCDEMIPRKYIEVLVDCYLDATSSGEFWKLSGVIDALIYYDISGRNDVLYIEFQDIRLCMMKHFEQRRGEGMIPLYCEKCSGKKGYYAPCMISLKQCEYDDMPECPYGFVAVWKTTENTRST